MTGVMKIMVAASLVFQVSEGADCVDVTAASTVAAEKKCYENIQWAKTTGILNKTFYYANYPNLTAESAVRVFQCVLWRKNHNDQESGGKEGHNCTKPCTFTASQCADLPAAKAPVPPVTKTPTVVDDKAAASGGGMPGYAWVLIVLGVCCGLPCLGLLCSAFICYEAVAFILDPLCGGKKGAQKKKRAVKKPTEAAPAPAATPMPVMTTSVPMPVYHAAPMVSHVMQAPPVYVQHAAPASVSYAAPASVSYADPGLVPYVGDVTVHHVDGHHSSHQMNVHQPHEAVITHHVDGHSSSLAMP